VRGKKRKKDPLYLEANKNLGVASGNGGREVDPYLPRRGLDLETSSTRI